MRSVRLWPFFTLLFGLAGGVAPATAQSGAPVADGRWEFLVAPYFLAPYMNGELTVRDRPIEVDANPGDIFDKLQFGAMLYAEASKGPWAIAVDGLYMNLGQAAQRIEAEADAKQAAVELAGFRELTPAVEVLIGGRINILDAGITFPALDTSVGDDHLWVDPIVGFRLRVPGSSQLIAGVRADLGGFGLGSDLAWQIYPSVGYRFSDLFALVASYRVLDMKYETGEGTERFVYDVTTFGPQVGLEFHF